jgi:hypothetical protein
VLDTTALNPMTPSKKMMRIVLSITATTDAIE